MGTEPVAGLERAPHGGDPPVSLAETIRDAAAVAFAAADDVPEAATYKRRASQTYAASSGVVAVTTATDVAVRAIVADYTKRERAELDVNPEDQRVVILAAELTGGAPQPGDVIVRPSGAALEVVEATTDPVGAVWVIRAKRAQ